MSPICTLRCKRSGRAYGCCAEKQRLRTLGRDAAIFFSSIWKCWLTPPESFDPRAESAGFTPSSVWIPVKHRIGKRKIWAFRQPETRLPPTPQNHTHNHKEFAGDDDLQAVGINPRDRAEHIAPERCVALSKLSGGKTVWSEQADDEIPAFTPDTAACSPPDQSERPFFWRQTLHASSYGAPVTINLQRQQCRSERKTWSNPKHGHKHFQRPERHQQHKLGNQGQLKTLKSAGSGQRQIHTIRALGQPAWKRIRKPAREIWVDLEITLTLNRRRNKIRE